MEAVAGDIAAADFGGGFPDDLGEMAGGFGESPLPVQRRHFERGFGDSFKAWLWLSIN